MKLFVLCNVEIPLVAETNGRHGSVFGGWLDDVSRFLSHDNELTICYMNDRNTYIVDGKNTYAGFVESEFEAVFLKLLENNDYDIFHIWGTEYNHSYICVSILERKNLLHRCVVSIQGLVSVYAYHYGEGIPSEYFKRRFLKEWIRGNEIKNGIADYTAQGKREIELLGRVKYVIGRTSWDKGCLQDINPKAIYFKCNENMRPCFYDETLTWDYVRINKHTIFVSQCSYPIKGFHFLLRAMPKILEKYPDAKIITTGNDFLSGKKKGYSTGSYRAYIIDLVEKNNLRDKISFRGILSAEEMKELYLTANVFVCPSTIENSPNSVGEAMIMGCPVVASYVGGIMDMLCHNEEGYLYQTTSSEMLAYYICKVFSDLEKTNMISKNARTRAKVTHNRDVNNRNLLSIYQEILEN